MKLKFIKLKFISVILAAIKKPLWEIKRFFGFFYRAFEELFKTGWKRRNSRYAWYYKHLKLKKNTVMFESFFGRGMLCNPYALFREMINNPDYAKMRFIWVLDEPKDHQRTISEFSQMKNVVFVKYLSREYLKALATSKYLINNVTFPSFFTKKPDQVYINTWHGIPLKKLGYDMKNGAAETNNIIRNFLQSDYMVSASSFLTEIYKKAYKLEGIYPGIIIEEGYPRLDTLVNDVDDVRQKLDTMGVKIDKTRKIIVYAPTWKENAKDAKVVLNQYRLFKETIEEAAPEYQVLIKAHQFVYQLIKKENNYDYIIPATIDANDVLPLADILISDYSSIFYDYLFFERPILFYIPDLEEYQNSRGLYTTADDLPGPCTKEMKEVVSWVKNVDAVKAQFLERIQEQKNLCCNYNVGKISKKVLDFCIKGVNDNTQVIRDLDIGKKKILFSRGGMLVNGITTSFLNLLKGIDYNEYDVSVYITDSDKPAEKTLIDKIDPRARVIVRKSSFNSTFIENVRQRMLGAYGPQKTKKFVESDYFIREARRSFGDASFDVAIDFEGYNLFYTLIVLGTNSKLKAIWQHNDMKREYETRFSYLKNIFYLYSYYDRIVSCSESIMKVNRDNLADDNTYPKYAFAKNLIDYERVQTLSQKGVRMESNNGEFVFIPDEGDEDYNNGDIIRLDAKNSIELGIPDGSESYRYRGNDTLNRCHINKYLPDFQGDNKKKTIRFVAVGRLSKEKNYISFVRAFHELLKKGYDAILYIIGDGPQKKDISKEINKRGLGSRIILVGILQNPFALMKECDCFVLPSLYEGQPMVINEARILNMPILMTDFSSSGSSKIPDGQYIIDKDVSGILDGLLAFVNGRVPTKYEFNAEQYNMEAYSEFLHAVGLQNE